MSRRLVPVLLAAALVAAALTACGSDSRAGSGRADRTVTLVTHDSFSVSEAVLRSFTRETGWQVRILKNGDAGAALNQVILTKGSPLGDVLFGVDTTFLTRALDERVLTRYVPAGIRNVAPALRLDRTGRATPIDFGDVCINLDRKYFDANALAPPRALSDLTQPRYRDLLVVQNPATSSPGLAFVAATVAEFGPDWLDYWDDLRANGVLVTDGWEQAYTGEFSGAGGGTGTRPIVVSYASSPAAEVFYADPQPDAAPTASVDSTCFRQVEFAGVLRGAAHPEGARKLIDFMLSPRFQRDVPLRMFVYPAVTATVLPEVFSRFGPAPKDPITLTPREIGAHRTDWIEQWTERVLR